MLNRRGPSSAEQKRKLAELARAQHAKRRGFDLPAHLRAMYRREWKRLYQAYGNVSPDPRDVARRVGILVPLLLLFIAPVAAHHAPSGWKYPNECCGNSDCFPMDPRTDVKWTEDGWFIVESSEVIPFEKAQVSGDTHFHRCYYPQWTPSRAHGGRVQIRMTRSGNGRKCLYVPAPEN